MKNLNNYIAENFENINDAAKGCILEFNLNGRFWWHNPEDDDFDEWNQINDWEIAKCGKNSFAIKIGDLKDIKAELR